MDESAPVKKQQQSMSRLAHRYIQDAYAKAKRSPQFEMAHDQAQLSDRVKANKWCIPDGGGRSFTKLFGADHDQKINQTASHSERTDPDKEIGNEDAKDLWVHALN